VPVLDIDGPEQQIEADLHARKRSPRLVSFCLVDTNSLNTANFKLRT
jgi:hypothetical protein